mmetsp:Transcript_45399/g.98322  ORF Transcript_45399/g.98322 Transcript_45399/m.98322 type:complete len:529 (+) Transcript_45399:1815-3401(+)
MTSSHVVSKCSLGAGGGLTSVISHGRSHGCTSQLFTFSPSVSSKMPSNGPSTSAVSVTILGKAISPAFQCSMTMSAAVSSFSGTKWSSASQLTSKPASHFVDRASLTLTAGRVFGCLSAAWTVQDSTVSALLPANAPVTGRTMVTVLGSNLNTWRHSPSDSIGGSASDVTAWLSSSQVTSKLSFITSLSSAVAVTTNEKTMSATTAFSHALGVSGVLSTNRPVTASLSVTVLGGDITPSDSSAQASIVYTSAAAVAWTSASTVVCKPGQGVGFGSAIGTVGVATGTEVRALTFEVMQSGLTAENTQSSGAASVTVLGLNSGWAASGRVTTASSVPATHWVSASHIVSKCTSARVTDPEHVLATVSRVWGSFTKIGTLNVPEASSFVRSNEHQTASASVTVLGHSVTVFSGTCTMGQTSASGSSWSSTTAVFARTSLQYQALALCTSAFTSHGGSLTMFQTVDAAVSSIVRSNVISSSAATVTVIAASHQPCFRSVLNTARLETLCVRRIPPRFCGVACVSVLSCVHQR